MWVPPKDSSRFGILCWQAEILNPDVSSICVMIAQDFVP
jgi:hypothetical protein